MQTGSSAGKQEAAARQAGKQERRQADATHSDFGQLKLGKNPLCLAAYLGNYRYLKNLQDPDSVTGSCCKQPWLTRLVDESLLPTRYNTNL